MSVYIRYARVHARVRVGDVWHGTYLCRPVVFLRVCGRHLNGYTDIAELRTVEITV